MILLQQRCSALYYSLHWSCVGQLVFTVSTGGSPVPSLPSKPKVLEMYFVLVVVLVQCSAVVACYLIMGAHRVHEADQLLQRSSLIML